MLSIKQIWPGSLASVLALTSLVSGGAIGVGEPDPGTAAGWRVYVQATEQRRARELERPDRFLAMAFTPDAAADRRGVLGGAIVIRRIETTDPQGEAIDVSGGMVHHWRGAVFVPGVTVETLLARLRDGAPPGRQEDVLESRVLERGPDRMRVFLKLQRRKVVTVVYNTEHAVSFHRFGPTRGETRSVATRIAELADPGTPAERERRPGEDRGFLWRLNAYWRYEQVPGGVIAECESLSLSRTVPALVRYAVNPLIESTARESMDRTLAVFRQRFAPMP